MLWLAAVVVNLSCMGGAKVKVPEEVAGPPGVTTEMVPVVPLATTAVMVVAFTTLNEVAAVPPKLTAVAPEKFVPVMFTVWPVEALVGVKELTFGVGGAV